MQHFPQSIECAIKDQRIKERERERELPLIGSEDLFPGPGVAKNLDIFDHIKKG